MAAQPGPSRTVVIRDVLVFHLKLWLEGLKTAILLPLSIGAAVVGLVVGGPGAFHWVLGLGERFDEWLNLYGRPPRSDSSRH